MAIGLGMTPEEWLDLKGKVDDSFWVMRIIGESSLFLEMLVEAHSLQGIPLYRMITTVSRAVPTSRFPLPHSECDSFTYPVFAEIMVA